MAMLTLTDAENTAARNRPWTIRLEYQGANTANASGQSSKYWFATGRGLNEQVETGHGAIGSQPQYNMVDWTELRNRVSDKLAKGYMWANTPYVRMSAGNLAKLGIQPHPLPTAAVPAVRPPKPAPVANLVQPHTGKSTPTVSVMAATAVSNALQAMGVPYSLICSLRVVRSGIKVTGYKALDNTGSEVMEFDPINGLAFAQTHNLDILFQ